MHYTINSCAHGFRTTTREKQNSFSDAAFQKEYPNTPPEKTVASAGEKTPRWLRPDSYKNHSATRTWIETIEGKVKYAEALNAAAKGDMVSAAASLTAAGEYPEAQLLLAKYYACGHGVGRNPTASVEYYLRAAGNGAVEAMCAMASIYMEHGYRTLAETMARRAAVEEYAPAEAQLADWLEDGRLEGADGAALRWRLLAIRHGHVESMRKRARQLLAQPGGEEKGLTLLKHAAATDTQSMLAMADMYFCGDHVPLSNVTGASYLRAAADRGSAEAECRLAVCFEEAVGVNENLAQAYDLYARAAASGMAYARARLTQAKFKPYGGYGGSSGVF
jgi:TPR repeat protein